MPRILVVDDDPAIQETLAAGLRSAGYDVETCRDGREVIPHLEQTPFDLVLLDVLIPHLNGFGVLEALRAHPTLGETPVILISGIYRRRNHRKTMMRQFNVVEYLDKPVSIADLREWVAKVVGPGAPVPLNKPKRPVTLRQPKLPSAHEAATDATGPRRREVTDTRLVEPAAQHERREVEKASRESFRTHAFLFQGAIRRNPVAALLGKLWRARRSGGLLLKQGKIKKIIYIRAGAAYAVKSNLVSECLGRLLVRERLISEEECAASIARMRESGKRQGEILVEMRSMTEKNLRFALELQLEAKLFDTFRWESGEFRFNPSVELPPPGATLEWQGAGVVVEGIRRAFDETRLRSLMLPILDVSLEPRERGITYGGLGFNKVELAAIQEAQLPATTQQLMEQLPLEPPDSLRVIYSLIALELWGPKE